MVQIALVSRSEEVLDAYYNLFDANGVCPAHFKSILELYRTLPELAINGLVVDIPAIIKATEKEKILLQAIEGIFPTIRANWNPAMGFRALFCDSGKSGEENLAAFLVNCRNFTARALRKDERKEKVLNVLFWQSGESYQSAQRAYTLDISQSGLFVCTCDPPPAGTHVWVKFPELNELTVKVELKWALKWGVSLRVPGFGASFVNMSDDLRKELEIAF